MLTGRSSTLRKKGLLVHTGIIDCGYRGPLFAGVWNMTDDDKVVAKDERIALLIVQPNLTKDLQPEPVKELAPHARGEAGFGSTGE
jgi:dUTPase